MQAATNPQVPVDIVEVIQGLIVLFVAAPPLIRAIFRLRAASGNRHGSGREGVERMTTVDRRHQAASNRGPPSASGRHLHPARRDRHRRLRPVLARRGRDLPAVDLRLRRPDPGRSTCRPRWSATCVGGVSVVLGIWRLDRRAIGQVAKRVAIGAVLVCFLIALLCWADAGDSTAVNLVNLMQQSFAAVHSASCSARSAAACASGRA